MSLIGDFADCFQNYRQRPLPIEAETGQTFTYGEVLDRRLRVASWLDRIDVRPGDVVVVSSRTSMALATFYLARVHRRITVFRSRDSTTKILDTSSPASNRVGYFRAPICEGGRLRKLQHPDDCWINRRKIAIGTAK